MALHYQYRHRIYINQLVIFGYRPELARNQPEGVKDGLSSHYHLVVTNVPYLARGKQSERLRKFAETRYPKAKNDLANVFHERCLEFSKDEGAGVTQVVISELVISGDL